jgi:Ca2+-binding EF-hand superfamily protein
MRLKKSIKTMNRLDTLCKAFEKYDSKSTGLLDVANYKTVLLKSKLGLSVDEINRMVRYT